MKKLIIMPLLPLLLITGSIYSDAATTVPKTTVAPAAPTVNAMPVVPKDDMTIGDHVKKMFSMMVAAKDVKVSVKDGVVTLSGSVATVKDKEDIANKVKAFPRVKSVVNKIEVKEVAK